MLIAKLEIYITFNLLFLLLICVYMVSIYLFLYVFTDAIVTLPQITYSVPYALISIRIESLGLGQGVHHFKFLILWLLP